MKRRNSFQSTVPQVASTRNAAGFLDARLTSQGWRETTIALTSVWPVPKKVPEKNKFLLEGFQVGKEVAQVIRLQRIEQSLRHHARFRVAGPQDFAPQHTHIFTVRTPQHDGIL